jgi:hypothetical protein
MISQDQILDVVALVGLSEPAKGGQFNLILAPVMVNYITAKIPIRWSDSSISFQCVEHHWPFALDARPYEGHSGGSS